MIEFKESKSISKAILETQSIIDRLSISKQTVDKALRITHSSMLRRIKAQVTKDISNKTRVNVEVLTQRIKTYFSKRYKAGYLYFKSYPVPLEILDPIPARGGLLVKDYIFDDSFIVQGDRYRNRGNIGKAFYRISFDAYPIDRARIYIDTISSRYLKEFEVDKDIREMFFKEFLRNLKFHSGLIV